MIVVFLNAILQQESVTNHLASMTFSSFQVSSSEFITKVKTEGHGACIGDSEGPVVHERDDRWYLEGVHSWGPRPCGRKGSYGWSG